MMLKVKQARARMEALRNMDDAVITAHVDVIEEALTAVLDAYAEQANVVQRLNNNLLDAIGKVLDLEAQLTTAENNLLNHEE